MRGRLVSFVALALCIAVTLMGCSLPWTASTQRGPAPATTSAVAACPPWARPATAAPLATPTPAPATPRETTVQVAANNVQTILKTPRPVRNLYSIVRRMVTRTRDAIPCRVRATPRPARVGQVDTFWVINPDQTSGYHQIRARLVAATPHVYMYTETSGSVNDAALRAAANVFETVTYPKERQAFGAEWSPGPDGDTHITILNARNLGRYVGGYFSSEDEYPRAVSPYSNERQMIYVNLSGPAGGPGTDAYNSVLAHEFQHMIHWYARPMDDSWLNEGMSVVAQHLNGYNVGGMDDALLARPDTMLGGWTGDSVEDFAHYGAGYLFLDYLAEHYGGYPILREVLASPAQAPANIDEVLARRGYRDRFDDVFARYVLANLLNDPAVAGGIYAYPSIPGKRAVPQHTVSAYPYADGSAAKPAQVRQYAAEYYDFRPAAGSGPLTITFSGRPTVPVLDDGQVGGQPVWWSNSGDNMDSTLTRDVDLTRLRGQRVSLTFDAWYNLERGFDYAYVSVSTDGGATWTPLRTSASTSDNPNGGNYGNGITGTSGGGGTPRWVTVRADLSAYAGQKVLLRFETISDDAVHKPGFALRSLSIPELGLTDTMTTPGAWRANGWIHFNNVLAERYVPQAVVYSAGRAIPDVVAIPVDATGRATYRVSDFGGRVTRVQLAVSALAPGTTIPASYTLGAAVE